MKTLGLFLVFLAIFIHDSFVTELSTNMSILYFSTIYLGIILMGLSDFFDSIKMIRYIKSVFILGILILFISELLKWNMPYEQYIYSVNSDLNKIIFWGSISILFGLILLKTLSRWKKM